MNLRSQTTGGRVAHAKYPWSECVCARGKVIVGNINTKSVYDMKNVDSNCRIDMLRVAKDEQRCVYMPGYASVSVVFIAAADFDEKYDYVLYANALQ